ncbi:DUF2630 family protein [Streptomyces guryensis]
MLERELDQCWGRLRQRCPKTEFGRNPDDVQTRPSPRVEGYQG